MSLSSSDRSSARAAELVRDMSKQLQLCPPPNQHRHDAQFKWEALVRGPTRLTGQKKADGRKFHLVAGGSHVLGDFLQEQSRLVRETGTTGTWAEQLTIALDYAGWHQFYVERNRMAIGSDSLSARMALLQRREGAGADHPAIRRRRRILRQRGKVAPRLILLR